MAGSIDFFHFRPLQLGEGLRTVRYPIAGATYFLFLWAVMIRSSRKSPLSIAKHDTETEKRQVFEP